MSEKTTGFGQKMRIRIAVMDVTITDLARAHGCARQNVDGVLKASSVTLETLCKYELTLGVDPGWLTQPQDVFHAQVDAERFPLPSWVHELRAKVRARKRRVDPRAKSPSTPVTPAHRKPANRHGRPPTAKNGQGKGGSGMPAA